MPLTIGAIGAPIVGNLLGGILGSGDREKAAALQQQAMQIVDSIPNLSGYDKEVILQKLQNGQQLTPQQEDLVKIGQSKVAQIKEDPALKDAQTQALQILQQRGQTGLGPEDRAALNQIRQQVQTDAEAKRQQILQNMQARGMGGSGAELAAQLSAAQAGTQLQSQQGDEQAAMASKNALQAILNSGTLSGQMRGQDLDVAKTTAGAEDAFKQFDIANQIATQQRNIAGVNAAQAANANRANTVSDTNTQNQNTELENQRQRMLQQAQYNAQLAQAKANARLGQASNLQQQAAGTQASFGQMGAGVGAGLGALGAAQAKKPAAKPSVNGLGGVGSNPYGPVEG